MPLYNVQVNNDDKLCDLLHSLHGLLEDYKKGEILAIVLTIVCFGGDIYICIYIKVIIASEKSIYILITNFRTNVYQRQNSRTVMM